MMTPESLVLLRNRDYFVEGQWVVVNPMDAAVFDELGSNVRGFHQFYDVYQDAYYNDHTRHEFNTHLSVTEPLDGAVVYMPKVKSHLVMLLANLAYVLKPGGQIFIVGHNKSGIKSCGKQLETVCEHINKVDSAKHCALMVGTVVSPRVTFCIDDYLTTKTYTLGEQSWQVCGLPGVFSQDALDQGTRLLLEHLPSSLQGEVLDFACGAGVIAAYVGMQNPNVRLVLSDVSALAIYAAQKTLSANGLSGEVVASNGLDNVAGTYHYIITNPPFHTGVKTDYGIVANFLQQAGSHLVNQGRLILVANSFLNYASSMEQLFTNAHTLAKTNKFAVYTSVKAK
ncbi:MAG: methyltransferase [Glaciecola sp.]